MFEHSLSADFLPGEHSSSTRMATDSGAKMPSNILERAASNGTFGLFDRICATIEPIDTQIDVTELAGAQQGLSVKLFVEAMDIALFQSQTLFETKRAV